MKSKNKAKAVVASVTVLLVEDDAWLADIETLALRQAGYTVIHSSNARSAMDEIEKTVPDVIVLDVLLPGSTAFALLNELQSYDDTQKIPIVLCTNIAEQFSQFPVDKYGVQRVVNKTTMTPDDIVVAVKYVVNNRVNKEVEYADASH